MLVHVAPLAQGATHVRPGAHGKLHSSMSACEGQWMEGDAWHHQMSWQCCLIVFLQHQATLTAGGTHMPAQTCTATSDISSLQSDLFTRTRASLVVCVRLQSLCAGGALHALAAGRHLVLAAARAQAICGDALPRRAVEACATCTGRGTRISAPCLCVYVLSHTSATCRLRMRPSQAFTCAPAG